MSIADVWYGFDYEKLRRVFETELDKGHLQDITEDDYAEISYTATETNYTIGTNAHAADATVATFTSKRLLLMSTTNCLVRFNGVIRVQHLLLANQQYEFWVSTTIIYVVRAAADGILYVHAEG